MVKICENTLMEGQCEGVRYVLILTGIRGDGIRGYVGFGGQNGSFDDRLFALELTRGSIRSSGAVVIGAIRNELTIELNPNFFGIFTVTINNVTVQFSSGGARGFPIPTNIEIFEIFRIDGLEDNCGMMRCRCEDTDETIICPESEGGICCISLDFIRNSCNRIN